VRPAGIGIADSPHLWVVLAGRPRWFCGPKNVSRVTASAAAGLKYAGICGISVSFSFFFFTHDFRLQIKQTKIILGLFFFYLSQEKCGIRPLTGRLSERKMLLMQMHWQFIVQYVYGILSFSPLCLEK